MRKFTAKEKNRPSCGPSAPWLPAAHWARCFNVQDCDTGHPGPVCRVLHGLQPSPVTCPVLHSRARTRVGRLCPGQPALPLPEGCGSCRARSPGHRHSSSAAPAVCPAPVGGSFPPAPGLPRPRVVPRSPPAEPAPPARSRGAVGGGNRRRWERGHRGRLGRAGPEGPSVPAPRVQGFPRAPSPAGPAAGAARGDPAAAPRSGPLRPRPRTCPRRRARRGGVSAGCQSPPPAAAAPAPGPAAKVTRGGPARQ